MKKIIFVVVFCAQFICLHAQQNEFAIVAGKVKNFKTNQFDLVLYKDASSALEYEFSATINPDGFFKIFVDIDIPCVGYVKLGNEYSLLYLAPDDSIMISVDQNRFNQTLAFAGRGSAKQNVYNRFYYVTQWLPSKAPGGAIKRNPAEVSDAEFFRMQDSVLNRSNFIIDSLVRIYKPDADFVAHLKNEVYYVNAEQIVSFPLLKKYLAREAGKPSYSKYFTDFVAKQDINNGALSRHPAYIKFLSSMLTYYLIGQAPENKQLSKDELYELKYKIMKEKISSERVRLGLMGAVISEAVEYGAAESVGEMYNDFLKGSADTYLVEALKDKMKQVGFTGLKGMAPDFTLSDIRGSKVSLSSFKGKVVYIDFWATWCGPCMMEMPNSARLQEKFRDEKDVVFLFVSIDDDEEKWKKTVAEKKFTGVQLRAEGRQAPIVKLYGLNSIPRYCIVAKDGKLVTANAPRPGNKEAENLIRENLK